MKTRYYESFNDDFEVTKNQDYTLKKDYNWVRTDFFSRLLSAAVYAIAFVFSSIYCYAFLHMRVHGRKNFKKVHGGFFVYGNHTQPVGDVFIPALCAFPRRIYTVVSTANYGIPIIGRLLPFLGALPIVESLDGMRKLKSAIEYRLERGCPIIIYPEAHVWEYYTGIRPFKETSFLFPVKSNVPTFAMTVTYKKSKFFKKPIMHVYIDGPFYPQGENPRQKACDLHSKVYNTMCERSKNNDFEYIKYVPKN